MAVSAEFMRYIADQFSRVGVVAIKRMFGGAGVYFDGRMFALLDNDELYLKANHNNRDALVKAGCKPFEPWPGHKMAYYSVPGDVLEDRDELAKWAKGALAAAPKKKAKPRKPTPPNRVD